MPVSMWLREKTGTLKTPCSKALCVSTPRISLTSQALNTAVPRVRTTNSPCTLPELCAFHHANTVPTAADPPTIDACTRKNEVRPKLEVLRDVQDSHQRPKLSAVAENKPKAPRAKMLTSSSRLIILLPTFPGVDYWHPKMPELGLGLSTSGTTEEHDKRRAVRSNASERQAPGSRPAPGLGPLTARFSCTGGTRPCGRASAPSSWARRRRRARTARDTWDGNDSLLADR